MKRFLLPLLIVLGVLSACVKSLTVTPTKVIALTLDTVSIVSGTNQQLTAKNYGQGDITWNSADTSVVSVTSAGFVTGKKLGQSVLTATVKNNGSSATCVVKVTASKTPGSISEFAFRGSDIGIGADSSIFIVGYDTPPAVNGYTISKLVNNLLVKLPNCYAVRVAVSPQGVPWVVTKSNEILRYNGSSWDKLPGAATDIGIGADGSVFAIGTLDVSPTGGYNIMKWNGSGWDDLYQCAGVRIAVSPQGIPWVVNKSNIVYQNSGGVLWNPIFGVSGTDIGIGADGTVYVTGTESTPKIYKYVYGNWVAVPGASGVSIAVSPKGLPWWVDSANAVFKLN